MQGLCQGPGGQKSPVEGGGPSSRLLEADDTQHIRTHPDTEAPKHSDSSLNDEKPLEAFEVGLVGEVLQAACQRASNNLRNAESAEQNCVSQREFLVRKK